MDNNRLKQKFDLLFTFEIILQLESDVDIESLNDLVEALYEGEFSQVESQITDLSLSKEELEPYSFWESEAYTRNCIAANEEFELLLLCWEPGQKTEVHCHNGQECWVKVIEGEFEELMYTLDENNFPQLQSQQTFDKTQISAIKNPDLFHSLENVSKKRAITLHLYHKPITECRYVNVNSGELSLAKLYYYSKEGLKQNI